MNKPHDNPRAIDLSGASHKLSPEGVQRTMNVLRSALQTDPGYAWSWHCNIAVAMQDEGVPHAVANHGAARFMRALAAVEPAHELPPKVVRAQKAVGAVWFDRAGRVHGTVSDEQIVCVLRDGLAEIERRHPGEEWAIVDDTRALQIEFVARPITEPIDPTGADLAWKAYGLRCGYLDEAGEVKAHSYHTTFKAMVGTNKAAYLQGWDDSARAPRPYVDSGPHLHVGSSSFESWYANYKHKPGTERQLARDSYAAGMGDPLVAPKYEIKGDAAATLLREHNALLAFVGEIVDKGHMSQEDQAQLRRFLDQPFIDGLNASTSDVALGEKLATATESKPMTCSDGTWMAKTEREEKGIDEPSIHELKTDPDTFQAVWDGRKTFEIRFNDRGFKMGDVLWLKETDVPGHLIKQGMKWQYTGRTLRRVVSHVLEGYGLHSGWVCLSFEPVNELRPNMEACANAWHLVVRTLNEVVPGGWLVNGKSAQDAACDVIRRLQYLDPDILAGCPEHQLSGSQWGKAQAFEHVCNVLDDVMPRSDWAIKGKDLATAAGNTILELDTRKTHQEVKATPIEGTRIEHLPVKPEELVYVYVDYRCSKGQEDGPPYYMGADDNGGTYVLTREEFQAALNAGVHRKSDVRWFGGLSGATTGLRDVRAEAYPEGQALDQKLALMRSAVDHVPNLHAALDVALLAIQEAHVHLGGALEESYRDSFIEAQLRSAAATIDMAHRGQPVFRRPEGRQLHLDHVRMMHARLSHQRTELAHKDKALVRLRDLNNELHAQLQELENRRRRMLPLSQHVMSTHKVDATIAHAALDIIDAVRLEGDHDAMLGMVCRHLLVFAVANDPLRDPAKVTQAMINLGLVKVS